MAEAKKFDDQKILFSAVIKDGGEDCSFVMGIEGIGLDELTPTTVKVGLDSQIVGQTEFRSCGIQITDSLADLADACVERYLLSIAKISPGLFDRAHLGRFK